MWDPFKTIKEGVNKVGGKLVNILKEEEEGELEKSEGINSNPKTPDPEQKKARPKSQNIDLLDETPKKTDSGIPKVLSSGKQTDERIDSPVKSKTAPGSENKIPKYEAKIGELERTLDERDEALRNFAIMNDKMIKQNHEIQIQNKELKEKLKKSEDDTLQISYKAHQSEESCKQLNSQIEEFKIKYGKLEENCKGLTAQLEESKAKVHQYQENIKSLNNQLEESKKKNHQLEENAKQLNAHLEELKKIISNPPPKVEHHLSEEEMNAKIAERIHHEIKSKESEIYKKATENITQKLNFILNSESITTEFKEKFKGALENSEFAEGLETIVSEKEIIKSSQTEAEINELKTRLDQLNAEKTYLNQNYEDTKFKLSQLEAQNNDLQEKYNLNEKSINDLKNELEECKRLINEAETSKKEFENKINTLNQEITTKNQDIEHKSKQLESISKELEVTSKDLASKTMDLDTRLQELSIKDQDLKSKSLELESKSQEFEEFKKKAENSLQGVADDTIKHEQELESIKDDLEQARATLITKEGQLEEKNKKISELEQSLGQVAEQLGNLKISNTELKNSNELLKEQMKDFEKSFSEIGKENEKNNTEMDKLKKELANEKKISKELDNTVSQNLKVQLITKLAKLQALSKNFELDKIINSKLVEQNKRYTMQSFLQSIEDGLNGFIDSANKKIALDIEEIKKKEKEKCDAMASNIAKLQNDLKEVSKREKDVSTSKDEIKRKLEEYQQTVESLTTTLNQYTIKIKDQDKIIREAKDEQSKYGEEIKIKVQEVNKLRNQLKTHEDELKNKKSAISNLESDLSALPELAVKLEKSVAEIANLKEIIAAKNSEIDTLNLSISNLQTILEENEQLKENISRKYDDQIKKIRAELDQANRKNLMFDQAREKYQTMEKDNEDLAQIVKDMTFKLKQSEQEKNEIKAECNTLIQKARTEVSNKEIWVKVDKRVVSSLLVKYFDLKATLQIKLQILETLSHILNFSNEDREKVGLHKSRLEMMKNTSDSDGGKEDSSLKDKFISFLNGRE